MKLISLVISLFALIINDALALNIQKNQTFLYTRTQSNSSAEQGNTLVIDSDSSSTTTMLKIPNNFIMNAIYSSCEPDQDWQSGDIRGFVGNIAALPKGSQNSIGGLKYSLEMSSWSPFPSPIASHSFYVTYERAFWEAKPASQGYHQCWPVGSSVGLGTSGSLTPDLPIKITVDRGTAIPGFYEMLIPIYWSYIEWKIHGYGTPPMNNNWPNLITSTPNSLMYIKFPVIVTSSCNLKNTNTIQLDHGVMTPTSAINNLASTTVDLNCTNSASVNVKLLGNEMDNKSSCSSWGTCELTFDNGKDEDKLLITGTKTLTIRSTFKPKTSEPIAAGKFSAHGVLQILVE